MIPLHVTESDTTVRLAYPRFVLQLVTGPDDPRIADPPAGCSFNDGRQFGVVEWIDKPTGHDVNDLARIVRLAAEHGRL